MPLQEQIPSLQKELPVLDWIQRVLCMMQRHYERQAEYSAGRDCTLKSDSFVLPSTYQFHIPSYIYIPLSTCHSKTFAQEMIAAI